nr:hypothetical protein [Cyanobacteria bacterium RUI128]
MKVKTTLNRVASICLFAGILIGCNFGNFAMADALSQVNTDDSIPERTYTLDTYSTIFNASSISGATAPNVMSVVGAVSDDGSQFATINYGENYYGFTVSNGVVLNFTNVKFTGARTTLTYGSVVNSAGTLNISNALFDGNKVVAGVNTGYGGAIYNTGAINRLIASFQNNSVEGNEAYGGAIYNTGAITSLSGNLINNTAHGTSKAAGGAIYTTYNMTLLADGEDYEIRGNTAQAGATTTNQAIYVDDSDIVAHSKLGIETKLTISAKNGGSWTIDDIIDGKWDNDTGTYYRYDVVLTGDTNSSIFLNNQIRNADVTIQDVNVYMTPDTFTSYDVSDGFLSNVYVRSTANISLEDNQTETYNFNILNTADAPAANFDFDIKNSTAGNYDVINAGISSNGNVIIHDINFLDNVPVAGNYKLLNSPTTKIKLKLLSGNYAETYTYTDITNAITDETPVKSYDYKVTLMWTQNGTDYTDFTAETYVTDFIQGLFVDTIHIGNDDIQPSVLRDSLNALNVFKTTYDRSFTFTSEGNTYTSGVDVGKTDNLSKLSMIGRVVAGEYSTVNLNLYKGFELGVGAQIESDNVTYKNARSSENGSVFNASDSNISLSVSNGKMLGNTSSANGGAIYIVDNSFLNVTNVYFSNNVAVSGGAIYSYSRGISTPYITNISGSFTDNTAAEIGGAIANVTTYSEGSYSGLISNISANFAANTVIADGDGYGGAIYNTGTITRLTGDFDGNSVISADGNAYGGAIYSGSVYDSVNGVYNRALIYEADTSFTDNYAKALNGNAYGGAIYTANSIEFKHSDKNNPIIFSGNYVEDSGGKRSNAIFVDTTSGATPFTPTLTFTLSNEATLRIDDGIDGGSFVDGEVVRDGSTRYNIVINGKENYTKEHVIFNDVKNIVVTPNGEEEVIVAGIRNAKIDISWVNLVLGTKTFYGENTALGITGAQVDMQDGNYDKYYFTVLNSNSQEGGGAPVEYEIDFRAYLVDTDGDGNNDAVNVLKDSFWVGQGSSGTIKLVDIGLNSRELYDVVTFLESESRYAKTGGYIDEVILERENPKNIIVLNTSFTVTLTDEDGNDYTNPIITTIKDNYLDITDGVYRLNDTDFIGSIGFQLNTTEDSFRIGVLERKDQLGEINRFALEIGNTIKELNINQHDVYDATENLGETVGTLTVNGGTDVARAIDFHEYKGFKLSDNSARLTINNLSIQNSSVGIESDADIAAGNFNIVLNDVSLVDNIVAITNTGGRIDMKNVTITFTEENKTRQNTLKNDGYIYIHSTDNNPTGAPDDGTKSYSRLYRSIINDGDIEVSGTTYFGLNEDSDVHISGSGNIVLKNDAVYTNMEFALLSREEDTVTGDLKNNTLTLNNGILRIGTSTFASSTLIVKGGTIDLSGSLSSAMVRVDNPYNINTYIFDASHPTTEFTIDIDFDAHQADQISIENAQMINSLSAEDELLVNVTQIRGVETLKSTVLAEPLKILTAPSNVVFKINLNPDSFTFYVDTYRVVYEDGTAKYVLTDKDFIGEVHLKQYQKYSGTGTEGGIIIEKNPIYNGIVELNQLDRYDIREDENFTDNRVFILTEETADPETEYRLPLNIGSTYKGTYLITADEGMTENGKIARVNMFYKDHQASYSGFEIETDDVSTITINGVEFSHAITYGRNEYEYVPRDEYDDTVPVYTERTQKNGSVIYLNSPNPGTTVTLIDTVMSSNNAEGLGGAIYASNDLTIIAKNLDSSFTNNIHKKDRETEDTIIEPYPGDPNDIYIAPNANGQDINLRLIAYTADDVERTVNISSGLIVEQNTPLNLYINDNDVNGNGIVHINLNKTNLGSQAYPVKLFSLNGGTFDLRDDTISTIYTSNFVVNSTTKLNIDLDLRGYNINKAYADMIWTNGLREKQGNADSYLVLSKEGINLIGGEQPVESIPVKVLDIKSKTADFMYFIDEEGNRTDGILLYVLDGVNYYAKLGLNGSIVVGSDPDCSDDALVADVLSTKNKTFKLKENKAIYNFGPQNYIGAIQSKKLTIKGDSYSILSTPSEIQGFAILGTDKISASKQQIIASNFDMKGFNGAFINRGGKIKLTNVNFYNNETEISGAVLQNYSGKAYLQGKKKKYAQVYKNFATENGGAVYNSGTLTVKYVDFGGMGANIAYNAGAIYSIGSATISNSNFTGNEVDMDAGAAYLGDYSKLTNDTFISNVASRNGGALYISATPYKKNAVTISKNNFYLNEAENGGAVYMDKGKVSIAKSNFGSTTTLGNSASGKGGGIYVSDTVVEPEYAVNNVLTLKSDKFADNNAPEGGAVYNKGTISSSKNTFGLTDKNGNVYANSADKGGAVYNVGNLTDKSSTVAYNTAEEEGGGIYNEGTIVSYNKKNALTGGLNSTKVNYNTAQSGGGVYNEGTLGTSKATFTANNAEDGAGLYNDVNGDATLISSNFMQNRATASGGAIYNKGTVTLNKTNIGKSKTANANTAVDGSAIYNEGTLNSTGSNINYNTATGNGALYNAGTANLASTTFGYNTSVNGGAVYNSGTLNIDYKTKFNSNTSVNGGAVYNASDIVNSLKGGSYSKNTATEKGGAIYNEAGKTLTVDRYDYVYTKKNKEKHKYYNSSVASNTATDGGGIYNAGNLTVSNTTLSGNIANNTSGLGYADIEQSGNGGAINNTGTLNVSDATFKSNNAVTTLTDVDVTPSEDGLKNVTTTTLHYGGKGGAIYNENDNATVTGSTFTSNKAGVKGGAISTYGNMTISDSTFTSNTTVNKIVEKQFTTTISTGKNTKEKTISSVNDNTSKGGAIYVADNKTLTITNSKFDKNSSAYGGAIYAGKNTTVNIVDTSFTNNTANVLGGAIYADEGSNVYVIAKNSDVNFKGNKAGGVANDIYLNSATVYLYAKNNHTINIYGDITGDGNGKYATSGHVVIAPTATLNGVELIVGNGWLEVLNESGLLGASMNLGASSNLSTVNNKIGKLSLKSLIIDNNTTPNVAIDMDLKNATSDKITAETGVNDGVGVNDDGVTSTGGLNVAKVNLISDSKTPVVIKVGEDSEVTSVSATTAETKEATYKLKSRLGAGGQLEAVAFGQKAKPCALAAPVAAQLGGYLTQINSYDQAFMNMDMNMLKTREERLSE